MPSLEFSEEPYGPNQLGNILAQFRARGFAVLPAVFKRDSVDAFREEVEAAVEKDEDGRLFLPDDCMEMVWPLRAPRLRAPLQGALSPSQMAPQVSVFETSWLVRESGDMRGDWHKDREQEGMPGQEYHYPLCVHLGIYYRDMEPEDGPTGVIPGSHQDQKLNPYNGSREELFLAKKEDVVMWDQRLWHRAHGRSKPGLRVFSIYGFHAVQAFQAYKLRQMPRSLANAWVDAKGTEDEVFYGGAYGVESVIRGLRASGALED